MSRKIQLQFVSRLLAYSFGILIWSQAAQSASSAGSRDLSWPACRAPLKEFRAFVITKAVNTSKDRDSWELIAPGGDTPDLIDCTSNWYASIDVIAGMPKGISFGFIDKAACQEALAKMKTATTEFPVVVVVDRSCVAHLAQ